jgi:hypothetical protein
VEKLQQTKQAVVLLVQLYIPSIQIEHAINKASGKWAEKAALEPIKHELIGRKIG